MQAQGNVAIDYPLKTTSQVEMVSVFHDFVTQNFGIGSWTAVQPIINLMHEMRKALDFKLFEQQLAQDNVKAEAMEAQIVTYIRYCYLIDANFRFEQFHPKHIVLPFPWTDSFDSKRNAAFSHIRYDMASMFYNLAIIYYKDAMHQLKKYNETEKKLAIPKLRMGAWCLMELNKIVPTLPMDPRYLPGDFSAANIQILYYMMMGHVYETMVQLFEKDELKIGRSKLASICNEAFSNFYAALDIYEKQKNQLPADFGKKIGARVPYYAAYYGSLGFFKIAKENETLIEEKPLGKYMGPAVAYMKKANEVLNRIVPPPVMGQLIPELKDPLAAFVKKVSEALPLMIEKNQRVYNHPEPQGSDLPDIEKLPDNFKAGPAPPKDIQTPPADDSAFALFNSEEITRLTKEFLDGLQGKKSEIENIIKTMNNTKDQQYAQNYVNFILQFDPNTMTKRDLPPDLKTKIDSFRSNGGITRLMQMMGDLKNQSDTGNRMIDEIYKKLEEESRTDTMCRQQYQTRWTRVNSNVLNSEYMKQLMDYKNKFQMAVQANMTLEQRFQGMRNLLDLFSGDYNKILALIPNTGNASFVQNNAPVIQKMKEMNDRINARLQEADKIAKEYSTAVVDNNVLSNARSAIAEIVTKKKDKPQTFTNAYMPFDQKAAQISKLLDECKIDIQQMCTTAKGLSSALQGASQGNDAKAIEELANGINMVNRMFVDLSEGSGFFGELTTRLTRLSGQVNDFCIAREMEKNNHIQALSAPGGGAGGAPGGGGRNIQVNNPFFNEQSMNFPIGTSVFVPGGQQPGQQGFGGANLGGQYIQSQYMNQQQGTPFQQPGFPYQQPR